MKILYYTHTYFLDCDLPLIKEFVSLGHEVVFVMEILPYELTSTLIDIPQQINEVGVLPLNAYESTSVFSELLSGCKVYLLNRPCKVFDPRNAKLRFSFFKIIKEFSPDIIHCTDFLDWSDWFIYFYKKKIIQVVHDPIPHTGEFTMKKSINRFLASFFLKKFVLLNDKQNEEFRMKYHLSPTSIFHNRLGVYKCIDLYNAGTSCNDKRNNESGKRQTKNILFLGRISPYKGVEYLLKAMDYIQIKVPDAVLYIVGGGELYFDSTLYEGRRNIHIDNRYVSMWELNNYLSKADIVVCPYIDATQSGVVMTAFAKLKPVIVTNVGGLPDMVENGVTGIIVPPRDSDSLSDAIVDCLLDKGILEKFKVNIYNSFFANGKNSWSSIAQKYCEIYQL